MWEKEIAKINRVVAAEQREARKRGDTMTRLRPFLPMEIIGAAICCSSGPGRHTPGRRTVVVSYCVDFPGRIALCQKHAKR